MKITRKISHYAHGMPAAEISARIISYIHFTSNTERSTQVYTDVFIHLKMPVYTVENSIIQGLWRPLYDKIFELDRTV